ncbi:MAG: hypothetical protein ABL994_24575, partial [Verrucomicrobiales bacterium]
MVIQEDMRQRKPRLTEVCSAGEPLNPEAEGVLVLRLVSRLENEYRLSDREWVQRSAFLLGRTMTGYEVLKIQSAVDCLLADQGEKKRPLGVIGHGEGGRLALFAAALAERINAALVSGAFGPREALWKEPADRNVFGLLREFGDAELGSLVAPRPLVIEHGVYPKYGYRAGVDLEIDPENRAKLPGKPGLLPSPTEAAVTSEWERLKSLTSDARVELVKSNETLSDEAMSRFLAALKLPAAVKKPAQGNDIPSPSTDRIDDLVRHNRLALIEAAGDRKRYFADLKSDSLENFQKTIEPYREKFRTEVIGDFELPLLPPKVRTRPY